MNANPFTTGSYRGFPLDKTSPGPDQKVVVVRSDQSRVASPSSPSTPQVPPPNVPDRVIRPPEKK